VTAGGPRRRHLHTAKARPRYSGCEPLWIRPD